MPDEHKGSSAAVFQIPENEQMQNDSFRKNTPKQAHALQHASKLKIQMGADIDDTADFGNPYQKKDTTASHAPDNILTKKQSNNFDNILKDNLDIAMDKNENPNEGAVEANEISLLDDTQRWITSGNPEFNQIQR